jgi:hypothetical protein
MLVVESLRSYRTVQYCTVQAHVRGVAGAMQYRFYLALMNWVKGFVRHTDVAYYIVREKRKSPTMHLCEERQTSRADVA